MGRTASPSPHTEQTGKSQSRRVHVCRCISGLSQHWCQLSWLPAQIKPECLTDFSSEELKEYFSHRLFSISQLFPTYFHQSLPKIAVSHTHKIQCFRNCDSCPFDASKHTYYCFPALSPFFWHKRHWTKRLSTADQSAAAKMTHKCLQPVRNYMHLWAGVLCKRKKLRNRTRNEIKRR